MSDDADVAVNRAEWADREITWTKREINGNHYIPVVYQDDDGSQSVFVYGSHTDHGLPDNPYELAQEYDKLASDCPTHADPPAVDKHVATVLNEAICTLERTQADQQALAERITAAVEANKEIHES